MQNLPDNTKPSQSSSPCVQTPFRQHGRLAALVNAGPKLRGSRRLKTFHLSGEPDEPSSKSLLEPERARGRTRAWVNHWSVSDAITSFDLPLSR